MDMKLELVPIPVTDVDRAKAFYTDQVGFHADLDERFGEQFRVVQLTPPGSACSIAFGVGIVETPPARSRTSTWSWPTSTPPEPSC
jgi:catechol 2,3-dioxygenase-like lactoylglutathione lyase family enzyme